MMLPSQVTLIPQFILFKNLGWLDTLLPLIVPTYFGQAFYIFLLRQFLLTLPSELDDAARRRWRRSRSFLLSTTGMTSSVR
jgi:ABC-type glycerol-3-phosphate transport system permease component